MNLNGFNMQVQKAVGSESIIFRKSNGKYFSAEGYADIILKRWETTIVDVDGDGNEDEEIPVTDEMREAKLPSMCDVLSNDLNNKLVIIEILTTNECRFFPILDVPTGIGKFFLNMSNCEDGEYTIYAIDTPEGCSFSYTNGPEPLPSWTADEPVVLRLIKEGDFIFDADAYADAYDFMVNGICYKINSDKASVTVFYQNPTSPSYSALSGSISIPSSVYYNGKTYQVTAIGNRAFQGCSNLTSLTIPNTLSSIKTGAFSGCSALTSITLTGKGAWNYNSSEYKGLQEIINQIKTINVGSEISSLGGFGFAPDVVNCYAAVPPICLSSTFTSYDGELHVPSTSTVAYFTAAYWQNFGNLSNNITERITLNKTEANISQWESLVLSATTNPGGSNLVWSSTNSGIATVSNEGIVTAINVGECDIFAALESNPAVYASCHVNVSYTEVSISLNNTELEMMYGEVATLEAIINPYNVVLTPTWTSSNTSVATVENGVVTAVGEGECYITATVLDKTATCHVVVNYNLNLTLNIDNAILGANQLLTVFPDCTPNVPVELVVTSSDPSVAMARIINRTNAPEIDLMSFTEKGMALNYVEALTVPSVSKAPALASEKAIMIVGVRSGTATISVTTADGKVEPVVLELRVADVDGDSTITTTDITCLYNYLLNGDETYIATSDIDGDGFITTVDITVIYNLILGGS